MAFSAGRLVSAFGNGTILSVDPRSPSKAVRTSLGGEIAGMQIDDTGRLFAATRDGMMHRIQTDGSASPLGPPLAEEIITLGLHPGGELVFLGTATGDVLAVRMASDGSTAPGLEARWSLGTPARAIVTLGASAYAATDSGDIIRLDPDGSVLRVHASDKQLWCALADPATGRVLTAGEAGKIVVLDARTMTISTLAEGDRQPVFSLAFNPSGTRLFAGSWDNSIRVHDLTDGEQLLMLRGHRFAIFAMAFDPATEELFSGCNGGELIAWLLRPAPEIVSETAAR